MIKFLKPSKFKVLIMVLIWVSMLCVYHLEDFIANPIIQRTSPEAWEFLEKIAHKLESSVERGDMTYVQAGIILFTSTIISRTLVSYLCSCVIAGIVARKRIPNKHMEDMSDLH